MMILEETKVHDTFNVVIFVNLIHLLRNIAIYFVIILSLRKRGL
jgi:hypothetical protein